jgi:hypothetical protein
MSRVPGPRESVGVGCAYFLLACFAIVVLATTIAFVRWIL